MNVRPNILEGEGRMVETFASAADHEECRRLHRRHGTTYYFATRRFNPVLRRRVHALYGFVRVPDEWVDNPGDRCESSILKELESYRSELLRGLDGVCPHHPVLRAFCDVMREVKMPIAEPLLFLDAMEADLDVSRYATFEELSKYMRGSAAAVGVMMCSVLDAPETPEVIESAKALGDAMQLTNFLRDVGEDARRGRIYIPLEDLEKFGVSEGEILEGKMSDAFVRLMKFEIERTRHLYQRADSGIAYLPREARAGVRLARVLYSRILDRIEQRRYDVFSGRAHTSRLEKIVTAAAVLLGA